MKHLELHIIQSVPVACLNRDDLNSPKTAVFGGVQRARVSSQSWKRAIREMSKEFMPKFFKGDRTRRMVFTLKNCFVERGIPQECAIAIAERVADIVETLDSKNDEVGIKKIKTLMFFSDAEYQSIANVIANSEDVKGALGALSDALKMDDEKAKEQALKVMGKILEKGAIAKSIKAAQLKDAGDIALFGRMVANDHSLTVEAASMFSHALSTHKADNEIDFFAAVDDLQSKAESGAGMTGTLEFNSATYYRFAALNLDMLADTDHLGSMTPDERKSVVRAFVEATLKAIPGARKNTMNGNTLPVYVLGVVREKGHPVQLINAFENPIRPSQGYAVKSVEMLKSEYAKLADTWGIEAVFEESIPEIGMKAFLDGVVDHVI
ncbi:MAG: type I-E CRISPR-associated protein Cas7/Cse4/CasC [Sulfuricella sp.]|nr:type I-E CRISPR-associated protein Cas7/Cse4/CasC [Sulfuricella sp.]